MYGLRPSKDKHDKLQAACVKATSKACICIETNTYYPSAEEAQRQTGIHANTIRYVCKKNPRYKKAGGYHWKYAEVEA